VPMAGTKRRVNILQVSYTYAHFVETGGPAVKVQAIAEGLAKRGHAVGVLTVSYGRRELEQKAMGGVEIEYLRPWFRYRTFTIAPSVVPFCVKRLRGFDVVHVYGLYEMLGPIVGFFCRRRDIPYVLEPIGMGRASGRSLGKKRMYNALFGRGLVGNAALIIATSEREQEELLEDGVPKDRLILRRNGVDVSQFNPPPPQGRFRARAGIGQNEKVVIFLGRMAPIKNLDMLIEAFASFTNNDERLVLVGPDEGDGYVDRLKSLAARLGLDGRVHFAGPLYGQEKIEALADADTLVLPSRSESFGMAALEAMACGKPVVVTEECGIAPYVKGRAGLVVRRETAAIAEGIRTVLEHPELASRFGKEGKTIAAQLSWDEPVSQMERLYGQLTERHRAA